MFMMPTISKTPTTGKCNYNRLNELKMWNGTPTIQFYGKFVSGFVCMHEYIARKSK